MRNALSGRVTISASDAAIRRRRRSQNSGRCWLLWKVRKPEIAVVQRLGSYRGELAVMYLPRLAVPGGRLLGLRLVPFRVRKFRLDRATHAEAAWLQSTLKRESAGFGTHVRLDDGNDLSVHWLPTECRP